MSFGAVADDYDRLRPPPPEAAIDWLVPEGCQIAVDVAAGTGLLSRALALKVPQVIAVEPDDRMADVLRARSSDAAPGRIRVARGTGESIPLPDASADGVFISSAWHWLDPERAPAEIARVLRDGGRLGLIWTGRDRETDWIRELDAHVRDSARPGGRGDGQGGGRRREIVLPDGLFGNAQSAAFTFTRTMAIDDVLGMLATYSGVITADAQARADGLALARAALERRFPGGGEIDVPMRSWCWRADRVARAPA
ncbi:MAG TPA: class I SAM-dependent methyltransferase [Streptosporangiaceae bacterium]|nr:class I SAM-dependent methyltransferase [Streptosporangiaceae bacterium]